MALPFQKELEKYKNIDEDELLGKLSEEELKQLENVLDDLDPESALLPAGFRQKDQTQKAATGPFDREHLLMYLEKEALEQKDREDFVPFTGEKKGRVFIPKEKPIETHKEEKVTLDPELEEALASASDTELYDLAAVLGVHNLLNNPKFDEETTNSKGGKGPVRMPLSQGPKPVTISFANHTSCRCMSKLDVYRQVHSIIRRSLPAALPQCQAANKTCPADYIWNNHVCRCLAQQDFIFSPSAGDDSADGFHDICGPNKELDEETCQCVCRGGLRASSCEPHKELDRDSCQCVCKNKLFPNSCGANREFDENTCQCICKRTCPRNQPLNPGKCACECTENPQKCFLKGKKFQHQTCSCYRRPCTNRVKHCEQGLSFSEEVCRCVPSYWKRPHVN